MVHVVVLQDKQFVHGTCMFKLRSSPEMLMKTFNHILSYLYFTVKSKISK